MTASRCLLAWLVLAACGGGSKPASQTMPTATAVEKPPADVACPQAVDGMFAVTAASEPPDLRARSAKVFVHRCETDHWSAETRQCMAGVKAPADADRCEALLSPEQKRELSDELSRELDAAGVRPEVGSGKPRPKPAKATKPDGEEQWLRKEKRLDDRKEERKEERKERKDERKKSGAPHRDPCEGGE
ncbi:MAG TPA: hypothetical protein VNO30_46870 [Kofleriaceae bacterium]|nr:hypothetical protein [Kofleriaceae bacterium]